MAAMALLTESVVPLYDLFFEHRWYLPSVGLCWMVAAAARGGGFRTRPFRAGAGIALGLFALSTFARSAAWRSESALWTNAVLQAPLKVRPRSNQGAVAMAGGDLERASVAYRRALDCLGRNRLKHDYRVFLGSARVEELLGRREESLRRTRQALLRLDFEPDRERIVRLLEERSRAFQL
jgi:tetratricopeptide (TPR) repeat protein